MPPKPNICSKHKVEYNPINYTVRPELISGEFNEPLAGYGEGTIIRMKFESMDSEIVCVHIQHKKSKLQTLSSGNVFYEFGLRTLYDHMIEFQPIVVFGDFNNYPDDESFLALTEKSDYRYANTTKVPYSYKINANDPGVLIDHAFTISDKVKMDYISAIDHGFNHDGMLITIE